MSKRSQTAARLIRGIASVASRPRRSSFASADCRCVDWKIHLIGTKDASGNPTVDFEDSNASITKYSCTCSP
jgi:hypothetical protein